MTTRSAFAGHPPIPRTFVGPGSGKKEQPGPIAVAGAPRCVLFPSSPGFDPAIHTTTTPPLRLRFGGTYLVAVQKRPGAVGTRRKQRGWRLSYYQFYEMNHAAMGPFRAAADAARLYFKNPLNPLSQTPFGRSMAAAAELFERTTRRYGKPEWGIADTSLGGVRVPVTERIVWERPFCRLIHFEKGAAGNVRGEGQPKLLI